MSSSDPFTIFLERRRADLRRIAACTSGEYSIDDAMSEAWLLAEKLGRRRGFPVDFLNKADHFEEPDQMVRRLDQASAFKTLCTSRFC